MVSHLLKWHLQNSVPVGDGVGVSKGDDIGVSEDDGVGVSEGDAVDVTLKLPIWLVPIGIPEPQHSDPDTTCRVYAKTAFGCNSVNENIPVVSVSYDTHDGVMAERFIFNWTIKPSGTTHSAVVYTILADVLVLFVTSTSLIQEATWR